MAKHVSEFVFGGDVDHDHLYEYYDEESDEEEEEYEEEAGERMPANIVTNHGDSAVSPTSRSERPSSLASYESRWKEEREREATAREQEKREQFRKLMGMDHRTHDGESIKTVLSNEDVEEEKKSVEESSSNASTHVCLKNIEISDSQLKLLNVFNDFPIPEDPGLAPCFWTITPPPIVHKEDGIQKFVDLAATMGLRAVNSVKEMLRTDTLNLRYYGLDPRIVRPICEAIRHNTSVQTIDLTDNGLTVEACCYLNDLLISNDIISCLKLSACRIGAEGARKLEEGIAAAPALLELDLSRCAIGDEGVRHVTTAIYHSDVLQVVDLSDNRLTDECAEVLQTMLAQSDSLRSLNLSWNSFTGGEFAKIFFQGLARNTGLESLDLSWNALASDSAPFLCNYLTKSVNLRELDLTGNRFTPAEAGQIAKALSKNVGLEVLRIGDNPLEAAGASSLIKALVPEKSPGLQLRCLDLQNVWANKDVSSILEILGRERPSLNVKLGGILSNYKLEGPNPRKIFLRRANYEAMSSKKKKLRKDFGHFVLTLEDEAVPKAKFKDSVNKFKLKLSDSLVDEIANAFIIPKGLVDQAALKELYLKEYPDTTPPAPKPETKKKKAKKTVESKSIK